MALYARWQSKPPAGTPLDWAHPLVRGMTLAAPYTGTSYGYDQYTIENSAAETNPLVIAGNSSYWNWRGSIDGTALYRVSFSLSTGYLSPTTALTLPASGSWTYVFRGSVDSIPGGNPGFWRSGSSQSGTTFCIINNSGNYPWMRVNGTDVLKPTTGTSITLGRFATYVFRWINGTEASWWVDGVKAQSASSSASSSADTIVSIGFQSSGSEYIQGARSFDGFWSRALTDDEIRAFTANPWQIYQPPPLWWLANPATGGPVSLDLAGLAISGIAGVESAEASASNAGLLISGAYGGEAATFTVPTAGLLVSGTAGGSAETISVALAGLQVSGAAGGFSVQAGGSITLSLAGLAISGTAGGESATLSYSAAGLNISATAGTFTVATGGGAVTVNLAGLAISVIEGGIGSFGLTAYPDPFTATGTAAIDPFRATSTSTVDPFGATSRLKGT